MGDLVVIPTAGLGTRMGKLTESVNKSLLPYKGKPLIAHIMERFSRDSRFIIPIGYLGDQVRTFLSEVFPGTDMRFVSVDDVDGPTAGTATTLLACRDIIDAPFFYCSCDTYWSDSETIVPMGSDTVWTKPVPEEDSHRYTMMEIRQGMATSMAFKTRKGTGWEAFTGLMWIQDHQRFLGELSRNPSLEFVDSLHLPMGAAALDSWKDFGTLESYQYHQACDQPYDFTKDDEITWAVNGKIVKWNRNADETRKRVARALAANPEALPENVRLAGDMMVYDMIPGSTGYQHRARHDIVDALLPWIADTLWKPVAEVDIKASSMVFYRDKTLDRIEKFTKKNKDVLAATSVNGIGVLPWQEYIKMVDWVLLSQCNRSVWMHGDLQPDNIIMADDGSIRAIDWRSSFGHEREGGDAHYDLAKLLGGCLIDYSVIKRNLFSVEDQGWGRWDIRVPDLGDDRAEEKIMEFARRCGLSQEKIRLLVPLIFWNMAPLHTPPFDDLLWCMGLLRFQEIYDA